MMGAANKHQGRISGFRPCSVLCRVAFPLQCPLPSVTPVPERFMSSHHLDYDNAHLLFSLASFRFCRGGIGTCVCLVRGGVSILARRHDEEEGCSHANLQRHSVSNLDENRSGLFEKSNGNVRITGQARKPYIQPYCIITDNVSNFIPNPCISTCHVQTRILFAPPLRLALETPWKVGLRISVRNSQLDSRTSPTRLAQRPKTISVAI